MMVTDTLIVDGVLAVLPLDPLVILGLGADASGSFPSALLQRVAGTPFVAPFGAGLLAAVLFAIKLVVWGVVFAVWSAIDTSLASVIFMAWLVASILAWPFGLAL
jgi:hypothetical protein